MTFEVEPIAYVHAARTEPTDDFWGGSVSTIELVDGVGPDSLDGIEDFSHVEVVFVFDLVDPSRVTTGARRPRGNPTLPLLGIFAQRAKGRPNRLGTSIVRVLGREGRVLRVAELDAIDGTPVLDIKPVMEEFLPRERVREPAWAREAMRDYWSRPEREG